MFPEASIPTLSVGILNEPQIRAYFAESMRKRRTS